MGRLKNEEAFQAAMKAMEGIPHEKAEVAAKILESMDIGDNLTSQQLYTERTIDIYIANKLANVLPIIQDIFNELDARGYNEKNRFEYNDLDNHLYTIDSCRKVVAMTSQNYNFLFILEPRYDNIEALHVYRWWEEWPGEDEGYLNYKIDLGSSSKKDMAEGIIVGSQYVVDYWSDNVGDNRMVERPDLKWYKEKKFRPKKMENEVLRYGMVCQHDPVFVREQKYSIYKFAIIGAAINEVIWGREALFEGTR